MEQHGRLSRRRRSRLPGGAKAGNPRMKSTLFHLLLAVALSLSFAAPQASPAAAQEAKKTQRAAKPTGPGGPKPANIDRNGILILVRYALLAVDQANKTRNYTVLRDLGAPGLQANTSAQLAEIFSSQRKQGIDLAGVAVLEPQLTLLPQIEPNGMMHMAGSFPSIPSPVDFELVLASVNGQWRLFGISVSIGHTASTPAAQAGSPPADDGKSSRVGKQKHRVLAAPKQP